MKSKISLKIEYAELYCGGFGCTPNGCPGHKSDFPAAIKLNGFRMALDDCDVDGDKDEKRWKETVKTLEALLS